ncbi:DMT family transporter [Pelosinus sp. sgz500959]|uniref:DMT family transporter n=1 Tax=Pelosinus sp. sgz500959 TaxID=3242472 RepID=UPI00366FA248
MQKNKMLEWLLLLTVFIWGMNTPIMKVGLIYISPVLYNAIRLLIAAMLAWPILWYSRTYKPVQKNDIIPILAIGLCGFFFCQLFLAIGLPKTTAGNASLMMALLPLNVVIMNRIFKNEKMTFPMAVGMVVSLTGAILVILGSGKEINLTSNHLIGTLCVFIAQIGNAYYTIFSRDLLARYSTYQITTYVLTVSAIAFGILAMPDLLTVSWRAIPFSAWASISYSALFALLFCNIVWVWVIGKLGSTRASLYQNLIPIFSIIGGWFFLGEVMGWLQCAGTVIIFIGLYISRIKVNKDLITKSERIVCSDSK